MSASKARLSLAVLILAAAAGLSEAQTGSVTGRVTSADTRGPLGGARVQLLDVNRVVATTASAEDGSYTIAGVAAGAYDVFATQIGYAPQRIKNILVTAGAATTADIAMASPVTRLDAVVSTASRRLEKAA